MGSVKRAKLRMNRQGIKDGKEERKADIPQAVTFREGSHPNTKKNEEV